MRFINPIEILNLQKAEVNNIDSAIIKKAKRILFADIDLSDDHHFEYKGTSLAKSDCEKAINELESNDKIEFYHFIANYSDLNDFLATGKENIFSSFRQESIYQLPEFINLISPWFSEQYDRALFKAYQNNNIDLLNKILSINPPVNHFDKDKLYKSLGATIKESINEIDQATRDIKNEESIYDETNIEEVLFLVQEKLDIDKINTLPQYFQSTRNQCATSIRNLSVNVFNTFNDANVALDLISYALDFDINGISKQSLTEDYNQLNAIKSRRDEEARHEPILRKYASLILDAKSKIEGLKNKTLTVSNLTTWISSKIDIAEVNALDSTFDEIRNQIALIFRAISVEVWNNYSDINAAIALITKAHSIDKLNQTTTQNLLEAKSQLNELKRKIDAKQQEIHKTGRTTKNTTSSSSSTSTTDNSGCLWLLGIAAIIGFISYLANSSNSPSSPSSYKSTDYSTPNNSNSYSPKTYDTSVTNVTPMYTEPIKTESPYKGNQLKDGASPLDGCFGKGRYAGQAWINFDNSNASDAIVCLVNVMTGTTIRNEYIKAGSSFKMTNVPSGTYYLKVYYGNDWNPKLENFCGTKGAFESDVHFSKSDNYSDRITVENSDYSYTTGSITLYTVANGNMSTKQTSESDFFYN
ncbi:MULTISPECIES: hypothetical protein [Niastella]|uniref:Uncharacterized protein n=1 Tax=Niastella soli TaxID=2821487 RepID=A0ABS3Z2F8_9BACT|nr:hypothetical protein [Niastella soli]MBO9204208.1 hypothetical protein [Niastella soli]